MREGTCELNNSEILVHRVGREDGKTSKRITTSETAKHELSESNKSRKPYWSSSLPLQAWQKHRSRHKILGKYTGRTDPEDKIRKSKPLGTLGRGFAYGEFQRPTSAARKIGLHDETHSPTETSTYPDSRKKNTCWNLEIYQGSVLKRTSALPSFQTSKPLE